MSREMLTGGQITGLEEQIIGEIATISQADPIEVDDRDVLGNVRHGLKDVRLLDRDIMGIDREILSAQGDVLRLERELKGRRARLTGMLIATGEADPVIMLPSGREVSLHRKEN